MASNSRRTVSDEKKKNDKLYYLVQYDGEDNYSTVSSAQIAISKRDNKKGTVKYENVNYAVTILKSGTQEAIEKKARSYGYTGNVTSGVENEEENLPSNKTILNGIK